MIRRAFLIAAGAVTLSGAVAMAFTPGLVQASRSWGQGILQSTFGFTADPGARGVSLLSGRALRQKDDVQGAFCSVRSAGIKRPVLLPENSEAHMSVDPGAPSTVDSSAIAAESLLTPAPAICRPKPDTTQARGSAQP